MKKQQHTPAPWEVIRIEKRKSAASYIIQQATPRYKNNTMMQHCRLHIAELITHRLGSGDNVPGDTINSLANSDREGCQKANAHLIAAAPELLEALEGIFEHCAMIHKQWGEGSNALTADAAINAARAAVSKATRRIAP